MIILMSPGITLPVTWKPCGNHEHQKKLENLQYMATSNSRFINYRVKKRSISVEPSTSKSWSSNPFIRPTIRLCTNDQSKNEIVGAINVAIEAESWSKQIIDIFQASESFHYEAKSRKDLATTQTTVATNHHWNQFTTINQRTGENSKNWCCNQAESHYWSIHQKYSCSKN